MGYDFRKFPYYAGQLGVKLDGNTTRFYLWAPSAERVILRLFSEGLWTDPVEERNMEKHQDGHFEAFFDENLDGTYYDYMIYTSGTTYRAGDPYAVASGANGERSMVVDLKRTDPEGWEDDKAPEKSVENIIYEIHVKDFTYQEFSGISEEKRGKFRGLAGSGTKLSTDKNFKTGLDYLADLGITHVQLMPIYDYGSVDELGDDGAFNWGYDPVNYNVPEGSYSSDPTHGEVRIRELKEMIMALHRKGLRVIMDVVYNHTYHLDSNLFKTEPWYFYRQNPDGSASNGSGCGNDIASERPMVHRYIVDSVLHWAKEYHIDGFRFDLMGLLDTDLMSTIRAKLDDIYGKGEKLVYGEPWGAGSTPFQEGSYPADKGALKYISPGIGAFCDATRDMIKGSSFEFHAKGFVSGGNVEPHLWRNAVSGWSIGDWRFSTKAPSQTICYVSSHDDWTLWDKLVGALSENESFLKLDPDIIRANKAAAALYFTMMGNIFMLSGEEAARTKLGVKNSYNSPLFINKFDWQRTKDFKVLVDYYKGLMRMRKKMPCLLDKSEKAKDRILESTIISNKTVTITLDNKEHERFKTIKLIYTGEAGYFSLPIDGKWYVLMDGENADMSDNPIQVENVIYSHGREVIMLGR